MILNLFKSKPILKEIIPKGFVDIHSHILPGIDDGPKKLKQSLGLISRIENLGISKIYATPHSYPGLYNNTNETIIKSYNRLINFKDNFDIKINYSSEYMIDNSLIKKASEKSILTLSKNYVLIEMPLIGEPNNLHDIIFELNINGYRCILAHPERYIFYENKLKSFEKLKKIGCQFQLNLLSIIGKYGKSTVELTKHLLKNDMIDFIGSDFHSEIDVNLCDYKRSILNYKEIDRLSKIFENNIKIFQ
tara:strand:+ start:1184 stop:1927 length:744 start_codon:yes stop_codon:yes gene_type:complete